MNGDLEYADARICVLLDDATDVFNYAEVKQWEGDRAASVVEAIVDADLKDFGVFMEMKLGEGLAKPERAIVKTYLAWKLGLGDTAAEDA